jgi:hypothetical protein
MVAEAPQQPQAAGELIAVGQAKSASAGLVAADVEGIRKLATQTKAIGIIMPPPDIRAIVDKTAQFVAKNGEQGELHVGMAVNSCGSWGGVGADAPPDTLLCCFCRNCVRGTDHGAAASKPEVQLHCAY